jgi:hypothetical protein
MRRNTVANWALLQEQLTGKPVVKRAKHGIHFDNGDGQVLAHFSGKPCHFQDTDGLWKPIDTGLLLAGDGWYGSPHSDVKIHKDGRVKVGGYQQKSTLVNAKEGVVDGDKIVREFKFGTQYLYMTENGFRQETVIDRTPTTAEAKYLIASESGTLDSKYKRSDITAVDADGDVHEFINLGQFKKWLDGAVYPVTIDPDFGSVGGGDNWIREGSYETYNYSSYPEARLFNSTVDGKLLIRFILSDIAASAVCTAASMYLTLYANNSITTTNSVYKISDANGGWVEGTKSNTGAGTGDSCWKQKAYNVADWAGSAGLSTAGTDYIDTVIASYSSSGGDAGDADEFVFNASGLAVLQDWFGDASNNGFLIVTAGNLEYRYATSEHATESYRPVLSVTYTAGGALRRINTSSFQQLTGGIHG